jgi:uncharacterized membrane protein YccC
MNALISRMRDYLERERLQPDLNRAARCTVAFMGPMLAAHWWQLPIEATFAAIAAQNIAIVDVRGSYPLRFSLLLAMTVVLAGATWLGGMTSTNLPLALGAVALLMLVSGLWRHLNAEYGPSLATASVLLFLIAVAHPEGDSVADRHFLAALAGGVWGVLVQGALWPFRAQHPLRRAVADSWLALSDLIAAMAPAGNPGSAERHRLIAERQALLRTALDQATATLAAAPSRGKRPYLQRLEELNLVAARFSTRFMALNASLETLMERPDFDALAPSFDPVITSLTNSARTIALTVVSRQPSHLAASEVRLRRLGNLLHALQDRILTQTGQSPDGVQLTFILRQINALVPATHDALRATIDRANEHSAFSLELFDLHTWTLRPLASALNLQWRPDPALVRFIARATVLQIIGVAIFKLLHLERGYWLPLTMLVVLQPEYGATRIRAGQRVIGTLAGSVLASVLLSLSLPPLVLMTAMAVTMAGFAFWLKRNYTIAVFFITLFVVLITEISMHVTIAFTLERLAATAAGGVLALLAALLFWPVWERQRFPALLAKAFLASRDYVRILGARLAAGSGYDAGVIAAKRAAELANSMVFTSLQRMSADPKTQQARIDEAAALANGNQRLTQALTVVALHLTPGTPLNRPELAKFIELAASALEALAAAAGNEQPEVGRLTALRNDLDQIALRAPKTPGTASVEQGIYGQFGRCTTELSAMLIAALPENATNESNSRVPGLPSLSR